MATEQAKRTPENYSEGQPDKKIRQVTSGGVTVKKRDPGRKFLKSFFETDAKSLREFLIEDQILPGVKDIVLRTVEMLLFGEASRSQSSSSSGSSKRGDGWTQKKNYSNPKSLTRGTAKSSGGSRFVPEVDDIYLESRGDAERTRDYLRYLIDTYDEVTVADLYEAVGKTPDWALNSVGWRNLDDLAVRRNRYGYYLDLPRVISLD